MTSFADAAERVLSESHDRKPLHYAAITEHGARTRPDPHPGAHSFRHHVFADTDGDPPT